MIARAASLFAVAATLAVASTGCCNLFEPPDPRRPPPRWRPVDPNPKPEDVDLGIATYPGAAPSGRPANFRFVAPPLDPKYYRAGYTLADSEGAKVKQALDDFATSVGYRRSGKDRFQWNPPEGCAGDMRCVFEAIARRNQADIEPLAERFRRRAREAKLTSFQTAELVVSFVQNIRYQIPKESPFGVLPPALVVSEKRGDCDSKSLLALMILKSLGIDSVIVSSTAHHHAMLGIALPSQGTTFEHDGRRYAMTECTAPGWPIGQIDRSLRSPNDWRATPVRIKSASGKGDRAGRKSKKRR